MDGILLFNKPILWTSHDAVDFVRRKAGQKAVGHAGTLDPLATGLLVMLLGAATKRSQELMGSDKDYLGTMTLGITTDTQDMEGRILSDGEFGAVGPQDIETAFAQALATKWQKPPAYSSVRFKGRKLYALARQGVAVEPEPRPVNIFKFAALALSLPEVHFFLSCSKGTYVRSVCEAVGEQLGCGATLSSLVRTRVGSFTLDKAIDEKATIDDIARHCERSEAI